MGNKIPTAKLSNTVTGTKYPSIRKHSIKKKTQFRSDFQTTNRCFYMCIVILNLGRAMCSSTLGNTSSPQWPEFLQSHPNIVRLSLYHSGTSSRFYRYFPIFGGGICHSILMSSIPCTWPSHCSLVLLRMTLSVFIPILCLLSLFCLSASHLDFTIFITLQKKQHII